MEKAFIAVVCACSLTTAIKTKNDEHCCNERGGRKLAKKRKIK